MGGGRKSLRDYVWEKCGKLYRLKSALMKLKTSIAFRCVEFSGPAKIRCGMNTALNISLGALFAPFSQAQLAVLG